MSDKFDIPSIEEAEGRLHLRYWIAVVVWALSILLLLLWFVRSVENEMLGLARKEAVANFNKDLVFRTWGTSHGGVYVPVTDRTQPSPYLANIPERDLITPLGRKLTLMNPAFMLRQMMEEYKGLYGVEGKITSLTAINPINKPDAWEAAALKAFEKGEEERFEVTDIGGQPYLRLIRPLYAEEGCLKCHGQEGLEAGSIHGGVSVSVPLENYLAIAAERKRMFISIMGMVWLLGMLVIWFAIRRSQQSIQERIDFEGRIWNQANFDALTGLSNRNLFMDRLERALAYARRDKHLLGLLFIDLDRFKDVNDTRGHAIGDILLREAGRRLRDCVRDTDTVSRLGGDEFTVILPEIIEGISIPIVARNIIAALSKPFELDGQEVHLSASLGITIFPQDGDDPGTLLRNADTAMYQAKADGRNTFRYFTQEMNQKAEYRVALESALRQALKRDEFDLFYQPIYRISDGELVGAEALICWESPERGVMVPDQFIPLAEESGLIVPLGQWVLERATADLAQWDNSGLLLQGLSVNVSTIQFGKQEFSNNLFDLVKRYPPLNSRLYLEITESIFMDEHRELGKRLEKLRQQGIRIAMDDFGTGYSSLGYLKRFPVDVIKIDRSFVRDVTTDPEDAALCEAIIAMAHHLGLKVVAEGVETKRQLQFLRDKGCDLAQGYLLGKPMPAEEFSRFLETGLTTSRSELCAVPE